MPAQTRNRTRAVELALLALLCLGAWCGDYAAWGHISLLRVTLVLSSLYVLFTRHRSQPPLYWLTLGFFLLYTVATIVVTFPYSAGYETIGGYANFLSVGLEVFCLLGLASSLGHDSLRLLYLMALAYVPLMAVLGGVEFLTGWHLPLSRSAVLGSRLACGFSYNPNDYAVLLALALLSLLAYRKTFLAKRNRWIDITYIILATAAFVFADCRSAIAVELLFVAFMCRQTLKKHWKILLPVAVAAIAVVVWLFLHDPSLHYRLNLYGASIASLYDSYGLGFGIWGDRYYLGTLENRDLFRGYVNAHSYLLQILMTSGLVPFLLYLLLVFAVMRTIALRVGRNEFWILPICYLLLLFAPSSSLFLWGQYLTFAFTVIYACSLNVSPKPQPCR